MKISLSKFSFLNILVIAFLFSTVIGGFLVLISNESYKERVALMEKTYIEKNKVLVQTEIKRTIKKIEIIEDLSYKTLRESLEEKVHFTYDVFLNAFRNGENKKSLIQKYKKELDLFKWDNETGYFYIFDLSGNILYHGGDKKLEHKNIFNLLKNNKELEYFIKDTMNKDENFGTYQWYKPNATKNKLYTKYVYALKLKELNIFIAAGIYKSEFQKKVQELVFEELKKDRFGENNYGYFWIHNLNNVMLMHPIQPELNNKDLTDFQTLDGQYLFQNMKKIVLDKSGGFISYIWRRPDTNIEDEKISYIHILKDWDVIIGSGFYLTELKDMLVEEKLRVKQSLDKNLNQILSILVLLIFLSLIIAFFISKRIRKVEESQKDYMNMLQQYQLILDKSVVVSKTNKEGIITYVNDNFCKVSGYTKDEVIGKSHNIVKHPETPKSQFKKLWTTISAGKIWKGILKNKKKNSESYVNNTTIVPIKDSNGQIVEYISSGSDITELFENRRKLQNIFKTDSLTGLGNRVSLIDEISRNAQGVLALINIDRFKELNDIKGHHIGDKVITALGERLFSFVNNENYKVYRVQADIFALFTKSYTLEKVVKKIERFMDNEGKKVYSINNDNFILTYTAGIANQSENLLTYADMALSEAKNKKIRLKVYDSSMNNIQEFKNNLIWVEKLHVALNEDRIIPYFQPIYNYHTQKIEKYECLMRLIDEGKVVAPFAYLEIAKKTKLYPELTYKIVEKSISKFANCKEEFSINLSIEDLMNEELMVFIYDYAEQKNIFERMVIEIVESEEIEDSDSIANTIQKFKDRGCKVAIDDFGSGYSNYEYLISLKADYVKIDGSITKLILEDERAAEVVKSIVTFAKKSNMKTIAEFVSSKELDDKVRELGVDYAQGWFYGKAEKDLL